MRLIHLSDIDKREGFSMTIKMIVPVLNFLITCFAIDV